MEDLRGKKIKKGKEFVVITKYPEDYKVVDIRSMKPRCHRDLVDTDKCMVLQELDTIEFQTKINGEKNILNYYTPNNVGILLSISSKSLENAKKIYEKYINPDKYNHILGDVDRVEDIKKKSIIIYDFIESI